MELAQLPRAYIHGDFNLSNILLFGGGVRLIDFEFSRFDLRMFDLAALFAPARSEIDRALERVDLLDDDVVLRLASENFTPPLTHAEREMYPAAVIHHLLKVLRDLSVERSRPRASFFPRSLRLLKSMPETSP